MKRRRKLLSPELLKATARQVAAAARADNIRIALVGGFALQQEGSPRLTADLDFIAENVLEETVAGVMEEGPLTFGGKMLLWQGVPVDWIVRDDVYASLYEAALDAAKMNHDLGVRVATMEHIAVMKMAAGRRRDLDDLEFLIVNEILDLKKTVVIIKRHLGVYAEREFMAFVEESLWRAKRK